MTVNAAFTVFLYLATAVAKCYALNDCVTNRYARRFRNGHALLYKAINGL